MFGSLADRGAPRQSGRRVRHVWVMNDVPPRPGVLLGWDREAGGQWRCQVAYCPSDGPELIIGWLAVDQVRPAS